MAEEPLWKQTETRRRVKQPPSRPQDSHSDLTLNGTISRSLLWSPDVKWRGCGGRSNYETTAEEQSRAGNRCPDRVEGRGGRGPPGAERCSTQFSQSRAAWHYQPFHQPLNARPCLLTNSLSGCERSPVPIRARLSRRIERSKRSWDTEPRIRSHISLLWLARWTDR